MRWEVLSGKTHALLVYALTSIASLSPSCKLVAYLCSVLCVELLTMLADECQCDHCSMNYLT